MYIDPKVRISNSYLLKIWKEKFNIFNSFILKPIDQLNKMIPGGSINSIEILSTKKENDIDNLFEKYQAISFTSEEETKGKAVLRKIGIKEQDKFVCFMVRDSGYDEIKRPDRKNSDYHSYRNFKLEDFELAATELVGRGYFVVRFGVKANKKF